MKKLLATLVACSLITTPVYAENIYEAVEESIITDGVVLTKTDTFTENGWVKTNVLEVDLTDEDLEIKVLTSPKGTSKLTTVKSMATEYGVKAAVNADFFNLQSGETNMLGLLYQNGELISTPSKDNFVSFAITENNEILFDYFTFSGTLYAENTSLTESSSCELYQINKVPLTTGPITMITPAWGQEVKIPDFNYAMICEKGAEDDTYRMVGLSWGSEKVLIPQDGAVFIANYSINGFLNENFAMGDIIRVETAISPDVEKIKEASGGNSLIVEDGEVCEFTNNITGKHPRTAMGIDFSGEKLILVTVDGREDDCAGFTQTDMANFMISLGCEKAINLDGGGSTTMVAEDRVTGEKELQNAVKAQRPVSTAIGVISNAEPTYLKDGEIRISETTVLRGDSVKVDAAFYDKEYNTLPIDLDLIKFSTTDKRAKIDENVVTFKTSGTHKVRAKYKGVTLEETVNVIDDIFAINIYPEKVDTTLGDKAFTVTGYDKSGNKVNIPPELISFTTTGDVTMEENKALKGEGRGTVTATYNALTSTAVVNCEKYEVEFSDTRLPDKYEGFIEEGEKIIISGNMAEPKNLLGRFLVKERLEDVSKRGDWYTLGEVYDPEGKFATYRKTDIFTERVIDNTKIVTLPNFKDSSIRATDSSSWIKIKTLCENIKEDNLVFILNEPFYQMNEGEKNVWNYYMDILNKKGVNVFVVSGGIKSEATVENGVRYLYVGALSTPLNLSYDYILSSTSPLTIMIKDSEIKYNYD